MIGINIKATVIGKTFSKVNPSKENGVLVELADGMKGFLHVSRMLGRTPEDRASTLNDLTVGSQVEVDVVSETTIDDAPAVRVSQWTVLRRARKQAAEDLMNLNRIIKGKVARVSDNFAIIALPDDLQGLLHVSRVVGDSEEERSARFATICVGEDRHVKVSEVIEVQGRLRVRLEEVGA